MAGKSGLEKYTDRQIQVDYLNVRDPKYEREISTDLFTLHAMAEYRRRWASRERRAR